jgi:Tol biopolymer transport system component
MGEVYRARDTTLNRDVALKVLLDAFASDPDRLARFEREAQLLASLNHPNIAAIYGLEHGAVRALVLELVEGPTLADRIARGPIALDEALPIARQIADALEAAHEQGVIHRDLKPANIKVRPDGTVKVLDFGLAKLVETVASGKGVTDVTMSPTITSPAMMTGVGVLLGTAAYMSPEQAKGRPADKRSDIWAFGCVLYEMLTGKRAFDERDVSDTLAAILRGDPDWMMLGPQVPNPIITLLRRCLEKDHKRRLRDIGDARLELDAPSESAALSSVTTAGRRKERFAWMTAVVGLSLVALGLGAWAIRETPVPREVRLEFNVPATWDPVDLASLAVSPDGQSVVFVAASDGEPKLWLRPLNSVELRPLPGTEDATNPFWSPDSRSVGFFAGALLKRIDLDGGLVRTLTDAEAGVGGSWNRDGVILFVPSPAYPIFRVSADGGAPAAVTRLAEGHAGHWFPSFLPDGRHFLYYVATSPEARGVYVSQLDSATTRRLFDADSAAMYASGHLLFLRQGRMLAQEFDAERQEVKGVPFPTGIEGVMGDLARFGYPAMSAAPGGVIAFREGAAGAERQFVWVDRAGREMEMVGGRDRTGPLSPNLSPDGSQLALLRRVNGNADVWLLEMRRGLLSRFTDHAAEDIFPIWSRDGSQIVFSSNRSGQMGLYQKRATGAGGETLVLPTTPGSIFASDWSPDGQFLLYETRGGKTKADLWALPLRGDRKPLPVVGGESNDRDGQFSPDGKWVAYDSDRSGRFEVYVQAFPGPGVARQVSTGGGAQVRWRPDGRELFFVALNGRLMAAPVQFTADGPSAGIPVSLFATRIGRALQANPGAQYIVSDDGQRFLMNTIVQDGSPTPIELMLNWRASR